MSSSPHEKTLSGTAIIYNFYPSFNTGGVPKLTSGGESDIEFLIILYSMEEEIDL